MTSPSEIKACPRCGIARVVNTSRDSLCVDCAWVQPPRLAPKKAGELAARSVRWAEQLACLVRDEGRDSIGDFLDRRDRQELYGLCVALAAMVPVDETTDDLLAWVRATKPRSEVAA